MTARNCWTCWNDVLVHGGTRREHHVCGAEGVAVAEWIERHVAPDAPGVPPSMPKRDAPPCPKWSPNLAESGRMEAE